MKIRIGDAEVDLSDGAAVAVAVGSLTAKLADADSKVGALTADLGTANTTIQTRDGEIVALKQQLKDAEVTPDKLQTLADARAKVITDAKTIAGAKLGDTAGKTDAEIRKAAVAVKLGDAAASLSDAAIEGAFVAYAAGSAPGPQATAASSTATVNLGDEQAAYVTDRAKQKRALSDGWRTPFNPAEAA